ncbi:organic cation transporter protein-like isoform X2 [Palaemon carinicauda]
MDVADNIEDVFNEIGFGRYQALLLVVAFLSQLVCPIQQLGSTVLSAPVPFRCSSSSDVNDLMYQIFSVDENNTLSAEAGEVTEYPSLCLENVPSIGNYTKSSAGVYKNSLRKHATGVPSCPEVEYDGSLFQSTVITEWDLVCERSALRPLYQIMFSVGGISGSLYCGHLSDWLGRKKAIQVGGLISIIGSLATALSPWYGVVIGARVLCGMGAFVLYFPIFTLLSEICPSRRRTVITMVPGILYFISLSLVGGIAFLIPHWRKLLLVCTSPLFILVPMTFFLDESPRWLLQKGRTAEAATLLKKAATQNKKTFSSLNAAFLEKLSQMKDDFTITKNKDPETGKENGKEKENESIKDEGMLHLAWLCFSSPGMRVIMIATPLMWLLKRALYMGIVLNANNFTSSNPFEYVAMSGAMGVAGCLLSIPFSVKLPRRVFMSGTLSIGGILLLLELPIPEEFWWAKWTLVLTAFCLVCGAFQVNYVYAAELFPTVIRTRGFSYTNVIGTVGEIIIPLVTDIAVQYYSWAPSVTFGVAGILASLLLPLLPETKDRTMPETMQDVEDRYWYEYKGLPRNSEAPTESNTDICPEGRKKAVV